MCIERNSVGDGIVDHLMNSPIAQNLYTDKGADLVEINMNDNQTVESMLKKHGSVKKYTGVYTGPKSREDMMAILMRHVAEFKDKFITKNITEDISRLVRTNSGKIEAGPGSITIISFSLTIIIFQYSQYLKN